MFARAGGILVFTSLVFKLFAAFVAVQGTLVSLYSPKLDPVVHI